MKYTQYIVVLAVALVVIPSQFAHAEFGVIDSLKSWREDKTTLFKPISTTTREELQGETSNESCEVIKTKIDERIANFDEAHSIGLAFYYEKKLLLENIIEKLKTENQDVTILETDLKELVLKIELFVVDGQIFHTKLETAKTHNCDNKQEFELFIEEVKTVQKKVVEDIRDINSFIIEKVIPDIVGFKK